MPGSVPFRWGFGEISVFFLLCSFLSSSFVLCIFPDFLFCELEGCSCHSNIIGIYAAHVHLLQPSSAFHSAMDLPDTTLGLPKGSKWRNSSCYWRDGGMAILLAYRAAIFVRHDPVFLLKSRNYGVCGSLYVKWLVVKFDLMMFKTSTSNWLRQMNLVYQKVTQFCLALGEEEVLGNRVELPSLSNVMQARNKFNIIICGEERFLGHFPCS